MIAYEHRRSASMTRRLKNEFDDAQKSFAIVMSPVFPDGSYDIRWTSRHSHSYVISISPSYPFKPPMIYLTGSRIDRTIHTLWELKRYKERYDVCGCECCISPVRTGSWSPCIVLIKILQKLEEQDARWYTVRLDYVRACFPALVSDVQNVIAEFL